MNRNAGMWWTVASFWMVAIFVVSGIPSLDSGLGRWDLILRKIAHVVEFGLLTVFYWRSATATWPDARWRKVLVSCFAGAVLYAISDEFHQSFVPGRGPSAWDVCIDAAGAAVAAVTIGAYARKREASR